LFNELFNNVLDGGEFGNLNGAYSDFKKSIDYQVLKEEIRRQQKLYEVLIEASFVENK